MAYLIQNPGGNKNKGGYGTGIFRIRLTLPNTKKVKTFTTGTKNRIEANKILDRINAIEKITKAENGAIIALYNDLKGDNGLIKSVNDELNIDYKITLSQAIEHYINDCKLRVSDNTVKSYKLALRDLCNALNGSIRLEEITKSEYSKLLRNLKGAVSDTTVNIRLRGIRAFFYWLLEKEYIIKIPFKVKKRTFTTIYNSSRVKINI